jgi:hypothetical protein
MELYASFSARSVSYHKKVCLYVYLSPIVARQRLGKHVPAATLHMQQYKNCWTRRFLCGPCHMKGK